MLRDRRRGLGRIAISVLVVSACSSRQPNVNEHSSPVASSAVVGVAVAATSGSLAAAEASSTSDSAVAVQVTEVVDGDTLKVMLNGTEASLRVIGINAPESGECLADEATRELSDLLGNGSVVLVSDVSEFDQFGRLLRFVQTSTGQDVGAQMIKSGYAIARRFEPDTSKSDDYEELQHSAQLAHVGMWALDACGPQASADIQIAVHADAPGDDSLNLNGEWVTFLNSANEPLHLDGWTVADESSSHRYIFNDLVLPSGSAVTLYSGCGVDSQSERFWCETGSAIWNNAGDTVFLRDPQGNNVATLTY